MKFRRCFVLRIMFLILAGAATGLPFTSCSSIVQREAVGMRQHALNYYNAQIMDNLISGSKGLLILHVDIDSLTTAVKASNTTALGAGRTSLDTNEETGAPLTLSKVGESVTKPFTAAGTTSLEGNLTSLAKPSKDPYIYRSYLQFLNLSRSGQRLAEVKSFDYKLEKGCDSIRSATNKNEILKNGYVEGTITRSDGKYYYVPSKYRQAYFDLVLSVTGKIDPTGNSGISDVPSTPQKTAKRLPTFQIPAPDKTFDGILEDKVRESILRKEIE